MNLKNYYSLLFVALFFVFLSCNDDETSATEPKLIVKITTNTTQQRLDNLGNPSVIPVGNAAQTPDFNFIAGHYLELSPNATTLLGNGEVLYHAPETTIGGATAIDFSQSIIKKSGETYLEIPLKDITAGTYQWVRFSVSYQNYKVKFYYNSQLFTGTIASFVGYNTYLTNFKVDTQTLNVNANKLQGFWAFETNGTVQSGQSAAGATTVPNPLFATSPIPQGSCVVTGKFPSNLVITGNETQNITLNLSLSVNNSFEWNDVNGNGKWDVESGQENVVDMGLRGLIPLVE